MLCYVMFFEIRHDTDHQTAGPTSILSWTLWHKVLYDIKAHTTGKAESANSTKMFSTRAFWCHVSTPSTPAIWCKVFHSLHPCYLVPSFPLPPPLLSGATFSTSAFSVFVFWNVILLLTVMSEITDYEVYLFLFNPTLMEEYFLYFSLKQKPAI